MKAVIVAGGRGERLKPLTNAIPKPMIKVGGKPILEHIINHFKKYGINDFILALCYLPQKITSYFGDGSKFSVSISYIFERDDFPMGTAGAILPARNLIKETFIVTYADILREMDITSMIKLHQKRKALATINIYKRKSRDAKSCVSIDQHGRAIKFIERPTKSNLNEEFVWANGSFYIFELEIFSYIPQNKPSDFGKDIFPKLLIAKKPIFAYPSYGYFMDIGNLKKLELTRKTFHSSLWM